MGSAIRTILISCSVCFNKLTLTQTPWSWMCFCTLWKWIQTSFKLVYKGGPIISSNSLNYTTKKITSKLFFLNLLKSFWKRNNLIICLQKHFYPWFMISSSRLLMERRPNTMGSWNTVKSFLLRKVWNCLWSSCSRKEQNGLGCRF